MVTPEDKANVKAQAKSLGINVVGKSIEKLIELIDAKLPAEAPADATMAQVRAIAKELQIPHTKTTPRADLVFAIADLKGWANEKQEVIEYLLLGGKIEELPGFVAIAPKKPLNSRETSAGGKVESVEDKPKKTPRKITKTEKPAKPEADGVTLASILEELDVDGRVARRKLRGSDIAKPGDSWAWPTGHKDIDRVRKLLSK